MSDVAAWAALAVALLAATAAALAYRSAADAHDLRDRLTRAEDDLNETADWARDITAEADLHRDTLERLVNWVHEFAETNTPADVGPATQPHPAPTTLLAAVPGPTRPPRPGASENGGREDAVPSDPVGDPADAPTGATTRRHASDTRMTRAQARALREGTDR